MDSLGRDYEFFPLVSPYETINFERLQKIIKYGQDDQVLVILHLDLQPETQFLNGLYRLHVRGWWWSSARP